MSPFDELTQTDESYGTLLLGLILRFSVRRLFVQSGCLVFRRIDDDLCSRERGTDRERVRQGSKYSPGLKTE